MEFKIFAKSYKELIKFIDWGCPSSIIAIVLTNTNHYE